MRSRRALCRLDDTAAFRVAKLLGMLGSDHDGEFVNTARMADRLVKQLGLRWSDIIVPANDVEPEQTTRKSTWREPRGDEERIETALRHQELLSQREWDFLHSIRGRRKLSPKRRDVLDRMIDRIPGFAEAAA